MIIRSKINKFNYRQRNQFKGKIYSVMIKINLYYLDNKNNYYKLKMIIRKNHNSLNYSHKNFLDHSNQIYLEKLKNKVNKMNYWQFKNLQSKRKLYFKNQKMMRMDYNYKYKRLLFLDKN